MGMEMRHFIRLIQIAAWASFAVIAYLTLAHVGLVYSIYFKLAPLLSHIGMREFDAVEHFLAFALFGALLCAGYPKHVSLICVVVFGSAMMLEFLQTLTPDRHGTVLDAIEKITGGACGILGTRAGLNYWQKRRRVESAA
jgi:hypothetical protein